MTRSSLPAPRAPTSRARRLAAALGLVLALAGPAPGQSHVDLLAAGDYPAARKALAAQVAGRPDAALHMAFLDGLILTRQGRLAEATAIYRQILKAEPRFEPARRELTAILAATGQTEGAVFHAERLLSTTQDQRLRAELTGLIAAQSAGKPRGITTRFSLLPSTNANGGTEADTVIVGGLPFTPDPQSRAQSAVGVNIGATAWNRWQLGERSDATLSAGFDHRHYNNAAVPSQTDAFARLDFGWTGARHRLSFGPVAEITWKGGDRYRDRLGVAVVGQYQISPRLRFGGSLGLYRQRHPVDRFLDGTLATGSVSLQRIMAPDLSLFLSVPFTIETTRAPHQTHRDLGLTVGVEKAWAGGLITGFSLGQSVNRYKGDYPAFGEPRRDRVTTARLALRHSDFRIGPFVPELTLTWTRSASNIPFHDYTRRDVGLFLSQRF